MSSIPDMVTSSESEAEGEGPKDTKSSPLTLLEKNFLLELIEERKWVLEDKKTDFGTISKKRDEWKKVSEIFNLEPAFQSRTGDQLKNWWNNNKRIAKKKISQNKRKVKKTGGGKNSKGLDSFVKKIASIVPQQMKSLENAYDCDGDFIENGTDSDKEKEIEMEKAIEVFEVKDSPVKGNLKRKNQDARSSLVDMEYEEHKIRLKILTTEYETAKIKKKFEERKLELLEIEHEKKYESKELTNPSQSSLFNN